MSDILSASSLVLAIIAVILSMWYPVINESLAIKPKPHSADNHKPRREILGTLMYRAIPLSIASLGSVLVFLPDAINIFIGSCKNLWENGISSLSDYNSLQGAFCLVFVLTVLLSVHVLTKMILLFHHKNKFK